MKVWAFDRVFATLQTFPATLETLAGTTFHLHWHHCALLLIPSYHLHQHHPQEDIVQQSLDLEAMTDGRKDTVYSTKNFVINAMRENKLTSLKAMLFRKYDRPTERLTGVKCRATSLAKKCLPWTHPLTKWLFRRFRLPLFFGLS